MVVIDQTDRRVATRSDTGSLLVMGVGSGIATGFIECRAGASALANSKGLFAYDSSSVVTLTATVRTPDGTGSGWHCQRH